MLASLSVLLDESSFYVAMPRMMYVPCRRLGMAMRSMQAVTMLLLLSYGFFLGGCYSDYQAVDYKHALWFQHSDESDSNSDGRHCIEPTAYWFSFGSLVTAQPGGCQHLSSQLAYYDSVDGHAMQGAATNIFFPTFIQDDVITSGWLCTTNKTRGCGETNHTKEEFFTDKVEEQFLTVFHGFKVEALQHAEGDRWAKGSSTTSGFVTHIVQQDGSDCHVGGKSLWTARDAKDGITGRLREWLACAGATLDADPQTFLTPAEVGDTVGLAPHLRTMGFSLQLVVDYRTKGDNMEGVLRVNILPRWTVRKNTDLVQVSDHSDGQVVVRERTTMGVTVSLKAVGVVSRFDALKLLNLFVDAVVLLFLPVYLTQAIILFCMGDNSRIYRCARALQVDIYRDFHCSFAKMMVALVGFRLLVGAKSLAVSAGDLPGLTVAGMLKQLRSVFQGPLSSGEMHIEELQEMVSLVFRHLDRDGSGEITCSEFIRSYTAHDIVKPDDAVHFFGTSSKLKKKGWMPHMLLLQSVLDDSQRQRRGSVRSLSSSCSTEFDLPVSPSTVCSKVEQSSLRETEEDDLSRSDLNAVSTRGAQGKLTRSTADSGSKATKRLEAGEADTMESAAILDGQQVGSHLPSYNANTCQENEVSGWSQGLSNLAQALTQASLSQNSVPRQLFDQLRGLAKDDWNILVSDHMQTVEVTLLDLKHRLEQLESRQMEIRWSQKQHSHRLHVQHRLQAGLPKSVVEVDAGRSKCDNGWLRNFEALQGALANLERRLEKMEIKNMEAGIAEWVQERNLSKSHDPNMKRDGRIDVGSSVCVDEWQTATMGRQIPPEGIECSSQLTVKPTDRKQVPIAPDAAQITKHPGDGSSSPIVSAIVASNCAEDPVPQLKLQMN